MTRPDQTRPDQTRPDQNYDFLYDRQYYLDSPFVKSQPFQKKTLSFREIKDCYVLPFIESVDDGCGIFDSEGHYVMGSSLCKGGYPDSEHDFLPTIARKRGLSLSNVKRESMTAVYIGTLHSVWGHLITDCMRLMWFIRSRLYTENFADCPVICLSNSELGRNHKRLLEMLGLDCNRLTFVNELTAYDKIILPDECFFAYKSGERFFTQEYADIFSYLRSLAPARPPSKVYYSYSSYRSKKIFGEDKLEKYFASKGYEIIHPERLSFDEQLNILANAESFASTVGSCSHNTLFLREGTEVILIPRYYGINGYQIALDRVNGINVSYVDTSFSLFVGRIHPVAGPFLYYISRNLREYFHDKDTTPIVSASDFRKCMRASSEGNNPDSYSHYSKVAAEYFGTMLSQSWRGKFMRFRESLKNITVLRDLVRSVKKFLRR